MLIGFEWYVDREVATNGVSLLHVCPGAAHNHLACKVSQVSLFARDCKQLAG